MFGTVNCPHRAYNNDGGDFMFPYFNGYYGGAEPLMFPLTNRGLYNGDLPEEIRQGLEERQAEIHDEEDLRRVADELMKRR